MKTRLRNPKGITLIALVVTIVVLLILAGVSLNLVLGNNGLINKAKEARDATKYGTIKDEYDLYKTNKWLEGETGDGNTTLKDFLDDLQTRGVITKEDRAQIDSENKLTISDKYEISFAKTLYDEVTDPNGSIKIGDYVKYNVSSGAYPSKGNKNGWADQNYSVDTTTQWRILGTEGNKVLLIAADPIKKVMNESSENDWDKDPYFYMKGAYSYVNCVEELDNICKIYSSNLGTARSLTIEDINNVLGVKVANNKVYFEDDPDTNIDASGSLGATYTYTENDYTPESYLNNKTHATPGTTETQDGYWYDYTGLMTNTIGNTTIGNLLFDGTLESDNYAKSYWLASPAAIAASGNAGFGPGGVGDGGAGAGGGMFVSGGGWFAGRFAVRPVVVLNSDVTVEDVPKTTGSTTPWTYDNSESWVANGNASDGLYGTQEDGDSGAK